MTAEQRLTRSRPTTVRFTADEFMELCRHPPITQWVGKVELIEGNVTRMSPTNIPHWRVQQDLVADLRAIISAAHPGWMVGSEPTVRFGPTTVRLPDVGVFREPESFEGIFEVADLFLAVEVADTTLRVDLGHKRAAYAKAGVPHFWVVDVNGRKTHVMASPRSDDYDRKEVVPFGAAIAVAGTEATVTVTLT